MWLCATDGALELRDRGGELRGEQREVAAPRQVGGQRDGSGRPGAGAGAGNSARVRGDICGDNTRPERLLEFLELSREVRLSGEQLADRAVRLVLTHLNRRADSRITLQSLHLYESTRTQWLTTVCIEKTSCKNLDFLAFRARRHAFLLLVSVQTQSILSTQCESKPVADQLNAKTVARHSFQRLTPRGSSWACLRILWTRSRTWVCQHPPPRASKIDTVSMCVCCAAKLTSEKSQAWNEVALRIDARTYRSVGLHDWVCNDALDVVIICNVSVL